MTRGEARAVRVLVCVGGAADARRLAPVVASLAGGASGRVKVLPVAPRFALPPPPPPPWEPDTGVSTADLLARAAASATRRAGEVAAMVAALRPELAVEAGASAGFGPRGILREAADWAAELLVVDCDGGTPLERWEATRTARALVSRAPCSLHVVRREARRADRAEV